MKNTLLPLTWLFCGNAIVCTADAEGELQDISPFTGPAVMLIANEMRKTRGEANDKKGS